MRRDPQRLDDILQALDSLAGMVAGQTKAEFLAGEVVRFAVAQRLTVVGEAANHITEELQQRYESVPWGDVIGLRNILVHGYFGIDWGLVWASATVDAPALRPQIAEILRIEFPD